MRLALLLLLFFSRTETGACLSLCSVPSFYSAKVRGESRFRQVRVAQMFPVPWLVWLCLSEAAECHGQVCLSGSSKPLEVVGVYNRNFLISFCFSQASSHYLREYI